MMTTTSHERCRISLKELPMYISGDSKTACMHAIVPYLTGEIAYITVSAVLKRHEELTFICTLHSPTHIYRMYLSSPGTFHTFFEHQERL